MECLLQDLVKLGLDSKVAKIIVAPQFPMGIYRFTSPGELYDTLLANLAPRAPQEEPLQALYIPLCVFCHQNLALTSVPHFPSISLVISGLEEGMAYHDLCAASCATDALCRPGAYCITHREPLLLSLLAAT
jgi:hypothetical protein